MSTVVPAALYLQPIAPTSLEASLIAIEVIIGVDQAVLFLRVKILPLETELVSTCNLERGVAVPIPKLPPASKTAV
jgi:hypothetical protein